MATIDVTKELWIKCDSCGSDLDVDYNAGKGQLSVTPCEKCLESERSEGYEEGYSAAEEK